MPPFWHGLLEHSLTFVSHLKPPNPGLHTQLKEVPEFWKRYTFIHWWMIYCRFVIFIKTHFHVMDTWKWYCKILHFILLENFTEHSNLWFNHSNEIHEYWYCMKIKDSEVLWIHSVSWVHILMDWGKLAFSWIFYSWFCQSRYTSL